MKICFFSDTHLGFDLPLKPRLNIRRRGEDFFNNTETILQTAIKEKCDLIIHGGDLFFRSKIPAPIIDKVYELLFRYAEYGIPIIIVPGNHERSVLPQSLLLGHPNLYVFSKPEAFRFMIKDKPVNIYGFPNIRRGVRTSFTDVQSSFMVTKSETNILVMHQAVDGSRIKGFTFRNDSDVVDISSILPDFRLVLCGHIHMRQIINNKGQIIIYSGSVERTSFQEMDEPKGFYIIELSDKSPVIKFHELPARPMFELDVGSFIAADNWQEIMKKKLRYFPADAIIRINCSQALGAIEKSRLSAPQLREIFPQEMNFQLTRKIFKD